MTEYNDEIDHYLDEESIIPIESFMNTCKWGGFIDYDGHGHPVKDGKMNGSIWVKPSNRFSSIPDDATHIAWYNR